MLYTEEGRYVLVVNNGKRIPFRTQSEAQAEFRHLKHLAEAVEEGDPHASGIFALYIVDSRVIGLRDERRVGSSWDRQYKIRPKSKEVNTRSFDDQPCAFMNSPITMTPSTRSTSPGR